jgi:hypothetical protein
VACRTASGPPSCGRSASRSSVTGCRRTTSTPEGPGR